MNIGMKPGLASLGFLRDESGEIMEDHRICRSLELGARAVLVDILNYIIEDFFSIRPRHNYDTE